MTLPLLNIADLHSMVRSYFEVEEFTIDRGLPTYFIKPSENLKDTFKAFYEKLQPLALVPMLRKVNGRIVLKLVSAPMVKGEREWLPLASFITTLGTILSAGYVITVLNPVLYFIDSSIAQNPIPHILGYALAILSIVSMHELGHKLACSIHGVKASHPIFIPFPPIPWFPIGTMGAFIKQKVPPLTRDELFDIGMLGPLFGFITSIFVSILGLNLSYPITIEVLEELRLRGLEPMVLPTPVLYLGLMPLVQPGLHEAELIYLHPIAWAGWVGLLITFLNAFPVGQLDGGHVLRAAVSEKLHLTISIFFLLVMALLNYAVMALVTALVALREHMGALDDASSLSNTRRLSLLALPIVWIVSLPLY